MNYWYYIKNGKQIGPVDENELRGYFASGTLDGNTMVWMKDLKDWTIAQSIENLVPIDFRPPPLPTQLRPQPIQIHMPNLAGIPTASHYPAQSGIVAEPSLASREKRLAGIMIDCFISLVIMLPFMYFTGYFDLLRPDRPTIPIEYQLGYGVAGWVLFLILNGYLLETNGQTIGKYAVGTRIIDLDGTIPHFGKLLLLRYFILGALSLIPFLGILIGLIDASFIFGKERRCLHDFLASTRVVNV